MYDLLFSGERQEAEYSLLYSYSKFPGRTGGRIFILCIISDEAEHMVEKREGEGR